MTEPGAEARLRRALKLAAAAVFVMTPLELVFTEHVQSTLQLFPFIASGLGLGALVLSRGSTVRVARVLLVLVCLVGVLGMWEHFEHNLGFEREIHPNLGTKDAMWSALFGAGPALAPGILILGAGLAWASTLGIARRP